MAGQRMRADQRRRQIMQVAQRLFAQRGYSQTTTAAIAAAAGVTEPILYRHFRSKRDLFLRLLEAISDRVIGEMRERAGRSDDPREQLKILILGYPQVSERFSEPFAMIDRALASLGEDPTGAVRGAPDVRPLLADHYRVYESLVSGIIQRGQSAGQLRDDVDPRVAAWFLIHAAMGWRLSHKLRPPVFRRRTFVPESARLLLDGLMRK